MESGVPGFVRTGEILRAQGSGLALAGSVSLGVAWIPASQGG